MNIYVAGYWNVNLGDDLFLYLLSRRYPNHDFYILAGNVATRVFSDLPNVHQLRVPLAAKIANRLGNSGPLMDYQVNAAKQMDAYCEVGGSLFMLPNHGMDAQYKVRKSIIDSNLPYLVVGSNFGPYTESKQLEKYRDVFKWAQHVTFRDQYSRDLFPGMGNIDSAPDLVFNLNPADYPQGHHGLLVSIVDPEGRTSKTAAAGYYQFLERAIRQTVAKGEQVTLMPFCVGEGDLQAAKKLQTRLSDLQVEIFVHQDIQLSLARIARARAVIASRYHAMILGWLFNKPTFVVSYSQKTNHVVDDLFPEQPLVNLRDLSMVTKDSPQFATLPNRKQICRAADQQFTALDQMLKE